MHSITKLAALTIAITFAGCANPINLKTSQNYTASGYQAIQAGEWFKARMAFGRAITNAELGGANAQTKAVLYYEYGRSSGVICDWAEAEKGLNQAYELDKQTGGPSYMSLYELARMNFDRKHYPEAFAYFSRVASEFTRIQADTRDPLGYAAFLDEYAITLKETGNTEEALRQMARADDLRNTFPGRDSHTEKTPYGTHCVST